MAGKNSYPVTPPSGATQLSVNAPWIKGLKPGDKKKQNQSVAPRRDEKCGW